MLRRTTEDFSQSEICRYKEDGFVFVLYDTVLKLRFSTLCCSVYREFVTITLKSYKLLLKYYLRAHFNPVRSQDVSKTLHMIDEKTCSMRCHSDSMKLALQSTKKTTFIQTKFY